MATRYCDLAADFVGGRSGADSSSNVLTGPGGLQTYLSGWDTGSVSKIAAGDLCYVKGTADLSKFFEATVSTDKSATWAIGDTVRDGTNQTWTGKLCYITSTALWIQIDAASGDYDDVSTAEDIENTTQSDSITAANFSSKDCPGIRVCTVSASSTSYIQMIGVNSSWSDDGTTAVLDGKSTSTNCMIATADGDYWHFKNIELINASDNGYTADYEQLSGMRLTHCVARDNGGDGFWAYRHYGGVWYKCIADTNSGDGFSNAYNDNSWIMCYANNNGGYGFGLYYGGRTIYCMAVENTDEGIASTAAEYQIFGCVIDGNSDGVSVQDDHGIIMFCRITNNSGYGINITDSSDLNRLFINYNVYYNNSSGNFSASLDSDMNDWDSNASPGADGYVDSTNDDYNVDSGAVLEATKYTFNWDGL